MTYLLMRRLVKATIFEVSVEILAKQLGECCDERANH